MSNGITKIKYERKVQLNQLKQNPPPDMMNNVLYFVKDGNCIRARRCQYKNIKINQCLLTDTPINNESFKNHHVDVPYIPYIPHCTFTNKNT